MDNIQQYLMTFNQLFLNQYNVVLQQFVGYSLNTKLARSLIQCSSNQYLEEFTLCGLWIIFFIVKSSPLSTYSTSHLLCVLCYCFIYLSSTIYNIMLLSTYCSTHLDCIITFITLQDQ